MPQDQPPSKLANFSDIFAKLCAGAAAIFAGIYLTWWKNDFDVRAKCLELVGGIASEYRGKLVSAGDIEARASLLASTCAMQQEQLLNLFRSLVQVQANEPAKVAAAQSVDLTSSRVELPGTDLPTKSQREQPPAKSESGLLSGWLAVGFLGSKTYSDVNFDRLDGGAVDVSPPPDTTLRSRWQVNVRPKVADWSKITGVLGTGQCFLVKETHVVPAGGRDQTWAAGHAVTCPPRGTSG